MNPFEMRGPEFLLFFVLLFVALTACAAILRGFLRMPGGEPGAEALDLSPYEVAYLAGDEQRVISAVVGRLVHEKVVGLDASSRKLTPRETELPAGASELDRAIHAVVTREGGLEISKIAGIAASVLTATRRRLEELGLVVGLAQQFFARAAPVIVAFLAPLAGVMKIFIGLMRDKPVGFLVLLTIASAIIGFIAFARPVHRSRRGDRAFSQLREANAAMEHQASRRIDSISGNDLMLALGLFGAGILASGALFGLAVALQPPKKKGGGDWVGGGWWIAGCGSSCSSGCGGGGCGGGCGGGGCGGCGGG